MRFLVASLLAVLPAAAAAAPIHKVPAPASPELTITQGDEKILPAGSIVGPCPKAPLQYAYKPGEQLKPRKLTELPPGNMYSAVYRRDANGCEAPIVVKYGVGRK